MPALGLLLEYPIFDTYNKRLGAASAKKPDDPEYRPEIDFEVYRDKIEQFKQEHIYPKMRDVEDQCGMYVLDLIVHYCLVLMAADSTHGFAR